MDEQTIWKYIGGQASDNEKRTVLDWIEADEQNHRRFCRMKNTWVLGHLPQHELSDLEAKPYVDVLNRKRLSRRILYSSVAAVLILLISVGVLNQFQRYHNEIEYLKSQQIASIEYHTNKGLKGTVILPDGSKVWLNSDSKISCPAHFEGNSRTVEFSGEGFFDVAKNPDRPMHIRLDNGISIVVKGTRFNLSSYRNDNHIAALLLEGEISIIKDQSKKNEAIKVVPNEKITIEKIQKKVLKTIPQETLPTIGWKEGWLIFDETPMKEVIKKLERWYGIRCTVEDPTIWNKKFTAKFKDESITQILEAMKRVSLLNYHLDESEAILVKY
ncbi:MAG: DUF4974 domain-containing protein [Odoribacter sp.]